MIFFAFENNESFYGGAIRVIYNGNSSNEYVTVNVTGGEFKNNVAYDYGAAFGVSKTNMQMQLIVPATKNCMHESFTPSISGANFSIIKI